MKKKNFLSLQPVLWSKNVAQLDLRRDRVYIIHQILRYGTLPQIKWLFRSYSPYTIKQVFIKKPMKIYSPSSLNFAKNLLLKLKQRKLDEKKYLSSSPRSPVKARA